MSKAYHIDYPKDNKRKKEKVNVLVNFYFIAQINN